MSYNTITEFDHIFRVLFIGDDSVGKTSLIQRHVEQVFSDIYMPTVGIDFKITTLSLPDPSARGTFKVDKQIIKLQVYDTGGSEHFRSIVTVYYRNVDAIVVVYDISDIDSFHHVEKWLRDALYYRGNDTIPKFLIGNKMDLPNYRRAVSSEAGATLAQQHHMTFFETSAKNKSQSIYLLPQIPVERLFSEICKECLLSKHQGPQRSSFDTTDKRKTSNKRRCSCC